jgi:hypothetical protein
MIIITRPLSSILRGLVVVKDSRQGIAKNLARSKPDKPLLA